MAAINDFSEENLNENLINEINNDEIQNNNLSNETNINENVKLLPFIFTPTNKKLDTEEATDILRRIESVHQTLESIYSKVDDCINGYNVLHEKTKNNLSFTSSSFQSEMKNFIKDADDYFKQAESQIKTSKKIASETEHRGNSSSSQPEIGELVVDPNMGTDELIASSVVGTLTFSELVNLYDTMGGTSTIQSSLTSQYEVVGIFLQDGKYYYRLYDSSLKRYFYAEIDNNSVFTTNYQTVLRSIEGQKSIMSSEPKISEEIFSKLMDPNEVYFVTQEEPIVDEVGIPYVQVLDGSDGNIYYVMLDNTAVETVGLDALSSSMATVPDATIPEGVIPDGGIDMNVDSNLSASDNVVESGDSNLTEGIIE